ncbi:RluA family pseudouridine synthase [Paenibacillus cremeus]|uniref:Pseudouridine synthase n=1 Tax=Paenibacillus cremeus TaxID=2163881 RepID=A0A559KID2_9BACL|nr:RluA family pseudouridine synthase [Paenibacillus cremeus]TVY11894.1 RluA family pseudouridine synthase [Paenibacillus cremeus]
MKDGRRKGEWLEWSASNSIGSLEEAVAQLPAGRFSDKWIAKLKHTGGIEWKGSRIRLRLFPEEPLQYMPEWADIEVLYEDDFCLVVNKPAGMKVHPTQEGESGTLLHAVQWHLEADGQRLRPRHIHRLDEDTSGPVLLAKCEWAQSQLDAEMREKRVERIYLAFVQGRVESSKGTVNAPIGRDRHHATRRRVSQTGDPSITHYEVVDRLRSATLVRLRLETGRTHQIRVHMSYLGHPLIGDALYGGPLRGIQRQALHGERLIFPHPFTGEGIQVEAPWPEDFAALYEQFK